MHYNINQDLKDCYYVGHPNDQLTFLIFDKGCLIAKFKEKRQICEERGCTQKAEIDYNGCSYFVCQNCYNKLNDSFDEEYD